MSTIIAAKSKTENLEKQELLTSEQFSGNLRRTKMNFQHRGKIFSAKTMFGKKTKEQISATFRRRPKCKGQHRNLLRIFGLFSQN
jgi:hypothetical protein